MLEILSCQEIIPPILWRLRYHVFDRGPVIPSPSQGIGLDRIVDFGDNVAPDLRAYSIHANEARRHIFVTRSDIPDFRHYILHSTTCMSYLASPRAIVFFELARITLKNRVRSHDEVNIGLQ